MIRQAIKLLREEKLFSGIYITGTALAITFTMIMSVVYYVKLANIYPEVNRDRTIYLDAIRVTARQGESNMRMAMQYNTQNIDYVMEGLTEYEYMAPSTLTSGNGEASDDSNGFFKSDLQNNTMAIRNFTNQDFFKIYEFEFLEGRPFNKEESDNGDKMAVISRDFADKMFGGDQPAEGKILKSSHGDYVVCGVVRGASQLSPASYADIYMPVKSYQDPNWGNFVVFSSIIMTYKDGEQREKLMKQIEEKERRIRSSREKMEDLMSGMSNDHEIENLSFASDYSSHQLHTLKSESQTNAPNEPETTGGIISYILGLVSVLLLVPAINLCGIVAGRLEKRLPELAVRKSFGATKGTLLWEVIRDNMVQTTIGGAIGLCLTWTIMSIGKYWVLSLFFDASLLSDTTHISARTMMAPEIFVGTFAAILIMNVASTIIPTWLSIRKPIVESLNEKQ